MPERADRLAALLAGRDLDSLLITDAVNIRWLTGFTGSSGSALVAAGGARRFITDFRYRAQIEDQLDPAWSREIAQDGLTQVAEGLADGPQTLGFDDAGMSVKDHARLDSLVGSGVTLVPAGGLVEQLRAIKDPGEVAAIRAATQLADAALEEVLGRGLAGRTEQAAALDLELTMRRMGAQGISFPPIVASGAHGALPHASPRDVVIPPDTLCVIDWGAVLDGYASDCTRTYATGDALDPADAEIYAIVLEAQLASLAAVAPGPLGSQVDAVAREIIDAAGHAEHFGHGLGHGVGMAVHEAPRLSKLGDVALVPGNVVTVEPGIYVPGRIGVRIEDLVVVTDEGHDVLTRLPKALEVAPAAP